MVKCLKCKKRVKKKNDYKCLPCYKEIADKRKVELKKEQLKESLQNEIKRGILSQGIASEYKTIIAEPKIEGATSDDGFYKTITPMVKGKPFMRYGKWHRMRYPSKNSIFGKQIKVSRDISRMTKKYAKAHNNHEKKQAEQTKKFLSMYVVEKLGIDKSEFKVKLSNESDDEILDKLSIKTFIKALIVAVIMGTIATLFKIYIG